ncbi:MAG: hypothetical protein HW416_2757 [Chloroflexi bacterium]|nr:hypothetical protein [Chloroflexota bacterium]
MADRLAQTCVAMLTVMGWAIVAYVVAFTPVSSGAQTVLYSAGFVAITGTVALVLELFHARRGWHSSRPRAIHLLGSGMRFAVALEFALWLLSLRMLTIPLLGLIIAGFLLLEFLFRKAPSNNDNDVGT